MKTRILSLLLAIIMVVTSVPMLTFSAFAEEAEKNVVQPIDAQSEQTEFDYNTLYVGYNAETGGFDRTSLIVDFFSAKSTDVLLYSNEANANNPAVDAGSRFGANLEPYIIYSTKYGNYTTKISGLTAPIKTPWYREVTKQNSAFGGSSKVNNGIDGLADGTHCIFDSADKSIKEVVISGGSVASFTVILSNAQLVEAAKAGKASIASDGTLNFESYDFSWSKSYEILNVFTKGAGAACEFYGFTDKLYASNEGVRVYGTTNNIIFASPLGDGYVCTGRNSLLYFDNAIKNARDTKYDDCPNGYTVQFVLQRVGNVSKNMNFQLGVRVGFSDSNGAISIYNENGTYASFTGLSFENSSTLNVNSYTIAFDRSSVTNVAGDPMTIHAYVNGVHKQTTDATWKKNDNLGRFPVNDEANVYAIRVYNFILSEAEVNQNNFADIAKWHKLDVSQFLESDKKAQVYTAFANVQFTRITKEEAQAKLDEIVGLKEYTVTFVDYNGDVVSSSTVEEGSAAVAPETPTREGYTFIGWDKDFSNITADTTVTAQYKINTYSVTFVDYDGSVISAQTVEYGADAISPAIPSREGYAFNGWDKEFTNITADTTVTAQYLANAFTVTFVDYDGTVLFAKAIEFGNAAVAPETPAREGYTFIGWDKDFSYVTENMTVTAQYKINTYTVTFVNYDGSVISTETVEYGNAAIAPENPTREGYTFIGWDKDFSNITADTTVTAQYKINTYSVTFVDYDGSVISTKTVEYGENAQVPANPTREGYTFIGWDKELTAIKTDLTVTAQYKVATFTVKFVDYNGTLLSTQTVEYGKSAQAPENPSQEGYNFVGWDKLFYEVKSDMTVTAVYESIVDWSKYDELYVGYNKETETFERTTLIVDFFRARSTDAPLTYSNEANANDISVNAYSRFGAASSNFEPYTVYTYAPNALSGLTAPIKAPWYAAVNSKSPFGGSHKVVTSLEGLADGTYCLFDTKNKTLKQVKLLYGEVTYTDLLTKEDFVEAAKAGKDSISADGTLNFETYDFSYSPSYKVLNVLNKDANTAVGHYGFASDVIPPSASEGVKVYASTNNLVYPSSWGDGYVHTGRNSLLYFDNAIKNARDTNYDDCANGYTVQIIAQRADSLKNNLIVYMGARIGFSDSNGTLGIWSENSNYIAFSSSLTFDNVYTKDVNSYTVAFDKTGVSAPGDTMKVHGFVNGVHKEIDAVWKNNDNMGRFSPGSDDANVFAIRIYNYVLTEDEVDHNNLIDIAKFYAIDIGRIEYILSLDEEAKKSIMKEAYSINLTREKSNDTAAAELEAIIAKYAPEEPTLEGTENIVEFLGYQARLTSFPGIRAAFTYDADIITELEKDGYSVEIGVIMAIANEGRLVDDLKVTKKGDGFVAAGMQMLASAVYKNGAAVGNIIDAGSDNPMFVYTITYQKASSQTYDMYTLDCIYRGYLIASKDGVDYITYYNCDSGLFEESISIYELSTTFMYDAEDRVDADTIKNVIDTVGYTDDVKAYYGYYEKAVEQAADGVINIPISQLELIYTVVLRAERDPLLARKLKYYEAAGKATNGEKALDLCTLINNLLDDYSDVHGVEVRDSLHEIDESSADIQFDVVTDKDPHTYTLGDSVTFTIYVRD